MSTERQQILETLAAVRAGQTPARDAPFARHMLRIPTQDFQAIKLLYPGLMSLDPTEATKEWERFERSAFAEPYRVRRIVKGVLRR